MEVMNVANTVNTKLKADAKPSGAAKKDKTESDFSSFMKRVSRDSNAINKETSLKETMPKKEDDEIKLLQEDKDELKEMNVDDMMNVASELASLLNMNASALVDENSLKDMVREACKNAGIQLSEDALGNLASKIGDIDIKDMMNAATLKSKLADVFKAVDFKGEISQAITEKLTSALNFKLEEKLPENLSEKLKYFLIKTCKETASEGGDDLAAAFKAQISKLAGESDDIVKKLSSAGIEASTSSNSQVKIETSTVSKEPASKEDAFLKSLAGDDEGKIVNRNTGFMMQLSQLSGDNAMTEAVPTVVSKNNVAMDMVKSFKFMENNGVKEMTVKIMPKELGEMMIKISMEGNVLKASVAASSKEAYDLLNANLNNILDKLKNDNVKIENISLNIYGQDTTFFKGEHNENQQHENTEHFVKGNGKQGASSMDQAETDMNDQEGNVNLLA